MLEMTTIKKNTGPFAEEKTLFRRYFGDSPKLRVIEFLTIYEGMDYPMIEIAEKSGVGYSTLKLFWKDLVKNKIVKPTRRIGNAKLFTLNTDNPAVKKFGKMYWEVTKAITNQLHPVPKQKKAA